MKVTSCHKVHKPNTWTWNRFGNTLDDFPQINYHLSISSTMVGCHSINNRTAGCCHSTICNSPIIVIPRSAAPKIISMTRQLHNRLHFVVQHREKMNLSEREHQSKRKNSKYVVFLFTNEKGKVTGINVETFESE